jgi:hypothetical protein
MKVSRDLSVNDHRSGLEIVGTIQAFLDERARSLPRRARQAREARLESDEFGSLGFDLDTVTIAGLGGPTELDPVERQDDEFAKVTRVGLFSLTPNRPSRTSSDLPSLVRPAPCRTNHRQRPIRQPAHKVLVRLRGGHRGRASAAGQCFRLYPR